MLGNGVESESKDSLKGLGQIVTSYLRSIPFRSMSRRSSEE